MNWKKLAIASFVLLIATISIAGASSNSATATAYINALNTAYGIGSCTTCHNSDFSRNAYGQLFEAVTTHKINPLGAVCTAGAPAGSTANNCNHAPVAVNDFYSTNENTVLTVAAPGVLANDTDADGNSLTAVLVEGPSHGVLSLNANGGFSYTPTANFNGSDSFTYKANDSLLNSNIATVTIMVIAVTPVHTAPVANAQSVTTTENTSVPVTLTATGGSTLTYSMVSDPANGTLSGTAPTLTYTPVTGFNGHDSFTFKVNDGTVDSNIATVSITVTSPTTTEPSVVKSITVDPSTANLKIGQNQKFNASAYDQFSQLMSVVFSWISSNPLVGTIDNNGNFKALANGTTTITASNNSIIGSATVTVSNASRNHDKHEDVSENESEDEVHEQGNTHEIESEHGSDHQVDDHNDNTEDEHLNKVTKHLKDTNKVTETKHKHSESGSNTVSGSNKNDD